MEYTSSCALAGLLWPGYWQGRTRWKQQTRSTGPAPTKGAASSAASRLAGLPRSDLDCSAAHTRSTPSTLQQAAHVCCISAAFQQPVRHAVFWHIHEVFKHTTAAGTLTGQCEWMTYCSVWLYSNSGLEVRSPCMVEVLQMLAALLSQGFPPRQEYLSSELKPASPTLHPNTQ
eukprot:1160641-Pelagomonas_calceolata.AAC.6